MDNSAILFGSLLSYSAYKYLRLYMLYRRGIRPGDLECVGSVQTLYVTPVKACRALDTPSAHAGYVLEKDGVADRHWFIGAEEHTFLIDLNEGPSLALVQQTVEDGQLVFNAPGMPTARLSKDPPKSSPRIYKFRFLTYVIDGSDCGDEISAWFSKYLKKDVRLYYFAVKAEKKETWKNMSAGDIKGRNLHLYRDDRDMPRDVFLFTTQASLDALNSHLAEPVKMRNMRPNVVVRGDRPAFDEDDWQEIYIGQAGFRTTKLCGRCIRTTINTDTGKKHALFEPFKTLKKIRKLPNELDPIFGIYHMTTSTGTINVGDKVYALRKSTQKNFLF